MTQKKELFDPVTLEKSIQNACSTSIGVLDSGFLCRSISVLNPKNPICVAENTTVSQTVEHLRSNRVGCVLVVSPKGKLVGIFSERDLLLKVMDDYPVKAGKPITLFMTKDPVAEGPDATIAFALNLMSSGGFRHLPLVDAEGGPIGIVSVKDVVDFIVESFTASLLNLDLAT